MLDNVPVFWQTASSVQQVLMILHIFLAPLANMSSSPTGCCAVQWAMWKGGGLTSRDRLNSSENYLLLGFLLAKSSQTVLLLVRQSVTYDNFLSQFPTPVPVKLNDGKIQLP